MDIQCLPLKCCPQHSGRRWQPLIAQILAGKLKAIPPLHGSLQLSKITKKNNHVSVPYNMRCWKCCPPSSTHFWHLFRKCAFTQINSISEIQSIPCLILAFNSFNVWGSWVLSMGYLKNEVYATHPHTLERKYQTWNWLYFGNWINLCKCTFPKKMPEMCGWRRKFPPSHIKRYVIIFLNNFTQL